MPTRERARWKVEEQRRTGDGGRENEEVPRAAKQVDDRVVGGRRRACGDLSQTSREDRPAMNSVVPMTAKTMPATSHAWSVLW